MILARLFFCVFADGHGVWREHGRVTGFFLEYDTGTENLSRLENKLYGYGQLVADRGIVYPVLYSLHSTEREANLHERLRGRQLGYPVATALRPTLDPAGPVWWVAGQARVRLSDLDCDHGPDRAASRGPPHR